MSVERFSLMGVEVVLAPGLNLLVCPTAEIHTPVQEALRTALRERLPSGARSTELEDALVISASEWPLFSRLCGRGLTAEALIAAGLVGGRRLPAVRLALEERCTALYAPRGRSPLLNRTLAELGKVQRELRTLGDPQERIAELRQKNEALTGRASNARAQLDRLEAERDRLGRIEALLPELQRLEALESELSTLDEVRAFPRGAAETLEALRARRDALEAERTRIDEALRAVEARWVVVDRRGADAIVDRVSVLLDVQRLWAVQLRALPDRIDAVAERRRALERGGGDGHPPDEALEDARLLLQHREVFSGSARAVLERIEAEVRRLTAEAVTLAPTTSRAAVQGQLAMLEECAPAHARVEEAKLELARAQSQRRAVEAQAPAAPRHPLPLGRAVLLGGIALAVGLGASLVSAELTGWINLFAGMGVACGIAAIHVWWQPHHQTRVERWRAARADWERVVGEAVDACARTEAQVAALSERRLEALREAGLADGAVPERFEARHAELSQVSFHVERREEIASQMEAWAALIAQAAQEESRARVDRHVAEGRLSGLTRELAGAVEPGAISKRRLVQLRVEDAALAADWAACAKAGELLLAAARALGLTIREPGQVSEALEGLRASLEEAAEQVRGLREEAMALHDARVRCLRERAEVAEGLCALLQSGGASDDASFRHRSAQAERFDQAGAEAAQVRSEIESSWGAPVDTLRQALREAGGARQMERGRARLAERIARLGGQVSRLEDEARRLRSQLETWERGEAFRSLKESETILRARADETIVEWAQERLALGLVERRLARFRQEQQAEVVVVASRLFGRLTGGAFVHVRMGDEEGAPLLVTDAALKVWRPEDLPRTPRELLLLAFRLAAVETLDPELPLVVDAALTGFGRDSLERITNVLASVAEVRQVVVLTRQPVLRDLFEAVGAHALEVDASAWTARTGS